MIDFERLAKLKNTFAILSRLIDYPEADTFSMTFRQQLMKDSALSTATRGEILSLFDEIAEYSPVQREEIYTHLFEMNRRYTLYMSYYKMTDSRERGSVLAKLKMLYEMFGISEATSELSDYLPLLLEFLAFGEYDNDPRRNDIQLALSIIEDGTYNLLKNAITDSDNPYIQLIRLTRTLVGSCIKMEVQENA